MSTPVLIIGQAPSRTSDPKLPLSGRTGKTLARWCGLSDSDFRRRFLLTNAADRWPGQAPGGGDVAPRGIKHRNRLRALLETAGQAGVPVVLLGTAVRRLVMGSHELTPFEWVVLPNRGNVWVTWCPHPSSVSRHWNRPEAVEQAESFFRTLARS